jgi:hypothetical protein
MRRRPSRSGGGTQERGVQHFGPVGGGEDDHRRVGLEAVHLREDLVQRLLALVVGARAEARPAGARAADRVELVDEDDRGRGLLGLLEQVAHAGGADADDRLDELRRRGGEEGDVGLAGHGARQQRLARARLAREQHAARDPAAEALVAVRVLEEVHDLQQFLLGLVDAGDVLEGDPLVAGVDATGTRARERAEPGQRPATRAARHPDEQADEQDDRAEAEQDGQQRATAVADRLGVDDHALGAQRLLELVAVDEVRDLRLEVLGRLRTLVRVADGGLELARDGLALRRDPLDVAVVDLVEEVRRVRDRGPGLRRRHDVEQQPVEAEQDDDDGEEARARPAPPGGLVGVGVVAR